MLYPRLSIIVPSYNQGAFLEECLLSIINQNYPRLELLVVDGGSTDESILVINKYKDHIKWWVSEKDRGQAHAINKGIEKATGEWVGWLNSDDCYLPGAFDYIFGSLPWQNFDFIFGNSSCGFNMEEMVSYKHEEKHMASLFQILKFFYSVNHIIPSQSVFVRSSLIKKIGLLNENLDYCLDLDWFCRIFLATERRLFYPEIQSFFRMHVQSKSGNPLNSGWDESLSIAHKYKSELNLGMQKKLETYISYAKWARHARRHNAGKIELIKIAFQYGAVAWEHPVFKMLIREKIDPRYKMPPLKE